MTDREIRIQIRLDRLEDAKRHLEIHKEAYRNSLKWAKVDRAVGNLDCAFEDMRDAENHRLMCLAWLRRVRRSQEYLRRLA